MTTGWVEEVDARLEHSKWMDELDAQASAAAQTPGDEAGDAAPHEN